VSTITWQFPSIQVTDVRPGDHAAASTVDGWLRDYASTRDPELRERIILAYLGLADRLAERYRHSRGTTPDDLAQTARAALVAAVDRFDPGKSAIFVPFAVACVDGELKRYLRDTSWRVRVPRPVKERALRLLKLSDELHQRLGRLPTADELGVRLNADDAEVLEAMRAAQTRAGISLDQPTTDDPDSSLGDQLPAPEDGEELEDLLTLDSLIDGLPELERKVVMLRFFHDLDQDAIAARIGYSQMHVSRLLRRALGRMRFQLVGC
jgi:RNA polymerase sigma-B factor